MSRISKKKAAAAAARAEKTVDTVKETPVVEAPAAEAPAAEAPVAEAPVVEVPAAVEAPKTETKAEKKPAVKKESAPKKETKPAEKVVEKSADKEQVFLQYASKEVNIADVVESCKAAYRANNPRKQIRSIKIYVKPDENKAYYVINDKESGSEYFVEL